MEAEEVRLINLIYVFAFHFFTLICLFTNFIINFSAKESDVEVPKMKVEV